MNIWVHGQRGTQYLISTRIRAQEHGTGTSKLQTKRKILAHRKWKQQLVLPEKGLKYLVKHGSLSFASIKPNWLADSWTEQGMR